MGAFGHVRVLGDLDHILKGEPVDDEPGVTVQSMKIAPGAIVALNDAKTELPISLVLTRYDFDGHRNPEDPEPEKYTRIASGSLDLVLTGKMEGAEFLASGYRIEDVDITLQCDTSKYIALELPDMEVEADSLSARFTSKDKATISPVSVIFTQDGRVAGIKDVNVSSFEMPKTGAVTINGIDADMADF